MDAGPQQDSEPGTELESRLSIQLARGVTRSMMQLGCTCLSEFTLRNSRRVDVIALDRKGLFTIIEIKTSVADFRADQKWHEYPPFCDQYYFAVPEEFPVDILPPGHGLLIADPYGAEIIRQATLGTMNASRRKALTLRFARKASSRLTEYIDPPLSKR